MLFVLITTAAFAAGGKMAYVDTQAVFDKAKLGKKYQGIVREYYESRKKILDLDAEEIQKMQEDYAKQKQAKLLNDKAQKEKEETINRKIAEFQKKTINILSKAEVPSILYADEEMDLTDKVVAEMDKKEEVKK